MMSEAELENWVTMKEAQAHLGVRRETITKWIATHNLPAYKVGRVWKFKLSEIDVSVKPQKNHIPIPLTNLRRNAIA